MKNLLDPKDVWNDLTNDQRIAATMIIFEKINEHIKKGGTYRVLIYDRLRFKADAYIPLYSSGGLTTLVVGPSAVDLLHRAGLVFGLCLDLSRRSVILALNVLPHPWPGWLQQTGSSPPDSQVLGRQTPVQDNSGLAHLCPVQSLTVPITHSRPVTFSHLRGWLGQNTNPH